MKEMPGTMLILSAILLTFTHEHRSYCSFLTLERLEQASWTGVAPCALRSPTLPVRIAPRNSVTVTLPPGPAAAHGAPGF